MQIELREISLNDGSDVLEMIREIGPGENGFMNDGYDMEERGFKEYLQRDIDGSKGINLPPQYVPQTKYWLYIDGRPVGIGKLRAYLNENLRKSGGHIGYCIRPSDRGKGYGNIMLAEMLKKANGKNIPKALVTCDSDNIRSRKVIEYNGGSLERIEDGKCLYWIKLTECSCIREIHIDDYDEMHALWCSTPGIGMSDADSRQSIHGFLKRNKGMSYCYEEEGKIIGTILCGHDGRRGYIYHVAVVEEYRQRGIGNILANKSLECLKAEGINKCHLFVILDNEVGNNFWSSTGWTKRDNIVVYSRNT